MVHYLHRRLANAAAEEQVRRREEEEQLTAYGERELVGDWEFKILRTYMGGFRDPERFRAALEQEKRGGWILVEKFDDERIRLKRRAGTKVVQGDFADEYDPYRTMISFPTNSWANAVPIAVLTIVALFIALSALFVPRH